MISLDTLLPIWFFLWALLWAVYFTLDGFDLGMGMLKPFIAKTDTEKRTIYNAAGPFWDGNEVWLITAGGVTFAAFPTAYAVMFSALYAPLLMLLFGLIFRGVAFEFRRKVDHPKWRAACDMTLFLGSFLPSLLLGVAFANLFMGIPIDENAVYQGTILTLLNPYGLAGGVMFVLIFALHGALWLQFKSEGELAERANAIACHLWYAVLCIVLIFLTLTDIYTNILVNLSEKPAFFIFLFLAVIFLLFVRFSLNSRKQIIPWIAHALFIICLTLFAVFGMYPGIIISSIDPAYSITVFNGASSELTLNIMFYVTMITIPVVISYQIWVYTVFSGKVDEEELGSDNAY